MRDLTKDVTLSGKVYRIRKMDALTGSWVAMQLATRMLPGFLESKLNIKLPEGRSQMEEKEFRNLQMHCLAVCGVAKVVGDKEFVEPIFHGSGRFNDSALENDIVSIMGLTIHSLLFSVSDFFVVGALKSLLESFGVSSQFNVSKLIASLTDRLQQASGDSTSSGTEPTL